MLANLNQKILIVYLAGWNWYVCLAAFFNEAEPAPPLLHHPISLPFTCPFQSCYYLTFSIYSPYCKCCKMTYTAMRTSCAYLYCLLGTQNWVSWHRILASATWKGIPSTLTLCSGNGKFNRVCLVHTQLQLLVPAIPQPPPVMQTPDDFIRFKCVQKTLARLSTEQSLRILGCCPKLLYGVKHGERT